MGPMEVMRVPSLLIRTIRNISISARQTDGYTNPTMRALRGNAWRELGSVMIWSWTQLWSIRSSPAEF